MSTMRFLFSIDTSHKDKIKIPQVGYFYSLFYRVTAIVVDAAASSAAWGAATVMRPVVASRTTV